MSWWAWLLVLYAVVGPVVWALCRMSAWQDADEAQRGLVAWPPSSWGGPSKPRAARKPAGQPRWLGQALPPRIGVSG